MLDIGWKPVALMIVQTLLIAALAVVPIAFGWICLRLGLGLNELQRHPVALADRQIFRAILVA
jgi:hypothetical protein